MCLVRQDVCQVVHTLFVCMVKFKFLALFPVDHIPLPVVSALLFFLRQFEAFTYHVIDRSSLSPHYQHLLFCCGLSNLFFFDIAGPYMMLFLATVRRDSVFLVRFPFLSHVQVFSYEISLVCRLKCPYCCFTSHFCFLVIFVLLMLVMFVLFLNALITIPQRLFV